MSGLRQKAPPPIPVSMQMRDVLFGDCPWQQWPAPGGTTGEPWTLFLAAREARDRGDTTAAIEMLLAITRTPSLESRHYLQAWHFLRSLGHACPPDEAKHVLGVVVEVGMEGGLDLLAAYEDHSARYTNFSGAGIVWERPNDTLDATIDAVFAAAANVVKQIGPWDKPRPGPPKRDDARLNILAPSGLHFGQAPMSVLVRDPLGGALFTRAAELMQALIALQKASGP